jgi:membrane protein YdbS with pleckstrin-like domain
VNRGATDAPQVVALGIRPAAHFCLRKAWPRLTYRRTQLLQSPINKEVKYVSYIEQSLSTGEQVEGLFKLHWFAWIPMVIWIILGFPTLGLTWLLAIYEFLRLKFLEQGVTNKRVILKKGIISRKTEEMKLRSIETVEINQGIIGRIFGFGTIKISGRGISDVMFKGIDDPMSVKKQIESISNPAA